MARRDLPADHRDAGRVHRHDERGPVAVAIHPAVRADVHVLRVDGARVHAHLAAQHEARAGLAHDAERGPLLHVLAQPVADGGGAGGEGQESAGAGRSGPDTRWRRRSAGATHCAAGRRRGGRARSGSRSRACGSCCPRSGRWSLSKAPAHRAQIRRRSRQREGPRRPASRRASGGASRISCHAGSWWRSYQATYSSTIGRVAGWIVTSSISPSPIDPDPASVVQGVTVLAAGSHALAPWLPQVVLPAHILSEDHALGMGRAPA